MGRASLSAVVLWSLASFAGCASIAGLDGIQEQGCAPNCSSADSSVVETSMQQEGGDTNMVPDTVTPMDSSSSGADTAMPVDSGMQDTFVADTAFPPDVNFVDSPFDSGCGDLNTSDNCGACGNKCGSTAATMSSQTASECCTGSVCPGSTNGSGDNCQYTCATNYLDCNGSTAPNLDGCECHVGPGVTLAQCCVNSGGDCPFQHNNGLSQSTSNFWDCVPNGTINSQLAQDACIAYVGAMNASSCQPYADSMDATSPDSWCGGGMVAGLMDCVCWSFTGTYMGQVFDGKAMGVPDPTMCYYGTSALMFH